MDHEFNRSVLDAVICVVCKKHEKFHGINSECEACDYVGELTLFADMCLCPNCIKEELETSASHQSPELQAERLAEHNLLEESRRIDMSIQTRSDIYNAETIAILEIEQAINQDTTIENKQFAIASELVTRVKHFQEVLLGLDEKKVEVANQQRATQTYLNTLSVKLRTEERERLRLADLTYDPKAPKPIKKVIKIDKKFDKAEIKRLAAELGVSDFTLQTIAVAKGMSPEQAANYLRKSINESKSEASS